MKKKIPVFKSEKEEALNSPFDYPDEIKSALLRGVSMLAKWFPG
ncbi:MAG: hypothetical protein WC335_06970 [Candidatus Omnitrophota bacterium]|jgi:hypothetical protein